MRNKCPPIIVIDKTCWFNPKDELWNSEIFGFFINLSTEYNISLIFLNR